jgi:catechol 2,3-dioxygenase-like lactoylglutathione lyase family enzyme
MIAHTTLPVSDYQKARTFYNAALAPLGYSNNMEYGEAAGFDDGKNTDFWISKEESVVPTHVAFETSSRKLLSFSIRMATTSRRYGTTTAKGNEISGPTGSARSARFGRQVLRDAPSMSMPDQSHHANRIQRGKLEIVTPDAHPR